MSPINTVYTDMELDRQHTPMRSVREMVVVVPRHKVVMSIEHGLPTNRVSAYDIGADAVDYAIIGWWHEKGE